MPPNILSNVVFPAPFGPNIPTISPSITLNETLFTAKNSSFLVFTFFSFLIELLFLSSFTTLVKDLHNLSTSIIYQTTPFSFICYIYINITYKPFLYTVFCFRMDYS